MCEHVPICLFSFFPPRFLEWELFLIAPFPDRCLLVPSYEIVSENDENTVTNWNRHSQYNLYFMFSSYKPSDCTICFNLLITTFELAKLLKCHLNGQ